VAGWFALVEWGRYFSLYNCVLGRVEASYMTVEGQCVLVVRMDACGIITQKM
jgi:hypothetical protein